MLDKVREVFTKEYRKETKYREFAFHMHPRFTLKNKSESVEAKVGRLQAKKFVSDFKVSVGEY